MSQLHNRETTLFGADADVVLERLFELGVLLADSMDRGLAEGGLTRARAELVWRLARQGPMTQRELSQALRCTPRNVTDLVDALETAGLVARGPHPTDRRATLVRLTDQGKAATAQMQAGYRELAATLFADLSGAELTAFISLLDRTLGRLRAGGRSAADG
jgi:DNA-binding MarR family transcriptional regulator